MKEWHEELVGSFLRLFLKGFAFQLQTRNIKGTVKKKRMTRMIRFIASLHTHTSIILLSISTSFRTGS